MTTTKHKVLQIAVILALMAFLLPIFIGAASLNANALSAPTPTSEAAFTTRTANASGEFVFPQKSKNMLGWGIFGIAAGEVFGAIGMGISYSRTKKKKAAAKAAAPLLMKEKEMYLKKMHMELNDDKKNIRSNGADRISFSEKTNSKSTA